MPLTENKENTMYQNMYFIVHIADAVGKENKMQCLQYMVKVNTKTFQLMD